MSMVPERIASIDLHTALIDARRNAGWNLRSAPIRKTTVGGCTVVVVPAKVWAYWRRAPYLLTVTTARQSRVTARDHP